MTVDYPTRELNDYLRNAGLSRLCVDAAVYPRVSDLGGDVVRELAAQVRQTLDAARRQSPPISQWEQTAETLLLDDDGSPQSHERQERFWQAVSTVVFAAHALIRLGGLDVLPMLAEMARCIPGHPRELAVEVLRRHAEPGGALAPEALGLRE